MASEPQILDPGIVAADVPLVRVRRGGWFGRLAPPQKKVPGILRPTRDQMVVLYGGRAGIVTLGWGVTPTEDTRGWEDADRGALLRRDWQETYSVAPPSISHDLAFDVTVVWIYTLTSAHTYMGQLNATSSTIYRDLVDRVVRTKASESDIRDPEALREVLDARLAAELNVRNDLIPGVETRFGRIVVRSPDPAVVQAWEDTRKANWDAQHRAHTFEINLEDQERDELQRQVGVTRERRVIRDGEATELLRGDLRHDRLTAETQQRGARERAALEQDDMAQSLRAGLEHGRQKIHASYQAERDEQEHDRQMVEARRESQRELLRIDLDRMRAELRANASLIEQSLEHTRLRARIEQNTERQHLELDGEQKTAELQEGVTDVRARADLARLEAHTKKMLEVLEDPNGPVAWAIAGGEVTTADYVRQKAQNLRDDVNHLHGLIGEMYRTNVDGDYEMARIRTQVIISAIQQVFRHLGIEVPEMAPAAAVETRLPVTDMELDRPDPEGDDGQEERDADEGVIDAETVEDHDG